MLTIRVKDARGGGAKGKKKGRSTLRPYEGYMCKEGDSPSRPYGNSDYGSGMDRVVVALHAPGFPLSRPRTRQ